MRTASNDSARTARFARLALPAFLTLVAACGGQSTDASGPAAADKAASKPTAADAGTSTDAGEERPFAGSVGEATTLISAVVDKKGMEIGMCIHEFRLRKKLARERVSISFGIDMEGKLLGVTSKGKEDKELKACVQDALKGAAFPRSNAGVITVTKTYEELVQ